MKSLYKDPLFHFLILAIGLFILHSALTHDDVDTEGKRIVVDQSSLLTFIQYRTKSFDPAAAQRQLDAFSDDELQKIIADYVEEEALYREAKGLGLDRDDYVIKRRMIQKIDYVARGFAESFNKVTEEDVRNYFEAHKADYFMEPRMTFTHVFFSAKQHGASQALVLAKKKLAELNRSKVDFNDAAKHGERFLYGLNYVDRSELYVGSHFGLEFTKNVFAMDADRTLWRGPVVSDHGVHLVMVGQQKGGYAPKFAEVEVRVLQEAQRAMTTEQTRKSTENIIASYDVDIVYEPQGQP